jgi:lipopolysaccharide/colanic/teichoic acid biosynthesis glycosyltransferase
VILPFVTVPPHTEPRNRPCHPLPRNQESETARQPTGYALCKATLDFAAALGLLILAAPLILLSMLLIKVSSRGPALYVQTRLGRNGRPFTIFKLRTMRHDCEHGTGACWSRPGDPRITPIGRLLRRTHLDELPQLLNVVLGHMSLVGPRPERPEFLPQLERQFPRYKDRLAVRPGVTGLAQVQLPPDTDLESVHLKLKYDLYYVQHLGFWLDARLLLGTAFKMLGLPFAVIRAVFGIPRHDQIENAYHRLALQLA